MTYFNTNREDGDLLKSSEANTERQEDLILTFFKNYPHNLYAPHEVQRFVLPNSPLTSIRRAMTNLTDMGLLRKSDKMVLGSYGKFVHTWGLKRDEFQESLF